MDDKYDVIRNGARLVLSYNSESNSFKGTVENTTNEILKRVRVEVHLSNGTELGPTKSTDLNPGEKIAVNLAATEKEFDGWSAHPEVGSGEHGEAGKGEESEHGGEEVHDGDKDGGGEHK